jgi:hypothetical protein
MPGGLSGISSSFFLGEESAGAESGVIQFISGSFFIDDWVRESSLIGN